MEHHLIYFTSVLGLGVAAQWFAWRLRLPSILLLLGLGLAMGEIIRDRGLVPDELLGGSSVLFAVVSLSVGVILFEGGLTLQLRELEASGGVVFRLITVAVLATGVLGGVAAWWILDLHPGIAALAGAIFTVSGPTVVAPLLRHVRPRGRIGPIVKWEGIVNDPVGAILAVLVFEAAFAGGVREAAQSTALAFAGGASLAIIVAFVMVVLLKRYWIPDFLQSPFILAVVVLAFVAANRLQHESGLLAVTVLGIYLANQRKAAIRHVAEFKENLQVLLISSLFIILASRLQVADLTSLGWRGLVYLATLILVVRPLAVFASTLGTDLSWQERTFLSFMAPRGIVAVAVASVFALNLGSQGVPDADKLVPLTFLVIVGTVGVYGLAAAPLARLLGLSEPNPQGVLFAGADPWVRAVAKTLQDEGFEVLLVDTSHRNVSAARMDGLKSRTASILSEQVQEELDLGGIGKILAVTANDEVNSLAALSFTHHFGRSGVYQLPPAGAGTRSREAATEMRGRLLFDGKYTHVEFAQRFNQRFRPRRTNLTEEFTFDDYQQKHGDSAIVLFRITEGRKLIVCTADDDARPKPGETIIGLVEEPPEQPVPPPVPEEISSTSENEETIVG